MAFPHSGVERTGGIAPTAADCRRGRIAGCAGSYLIYLIAKSGR
ncbi:hypothetical protein [Desulfopila aestuarii]|nr:hypothetical protein [Desulfopila aestuarii]